MQCMKSGEQSMAAGFNGLGYSMVTDGRYFETLFAPDSYGSIFKARAAAT